MRIKYLIEIRSKLTKSKFSHKTLSLIPCLNKRGEKKIQINNHRFIIYSSSSITLPLELIGLFKFVNL
jgi:hypothetical protein